MRIVSIAIMMLLCSALMLADDFYDIDTIHSIEITFAESNWDDILHQLYQAGNEERLTGTVLIDGVQFDSVGVRYKGNSSYSPQRTKNPLNIKLDYIIDDQLLGPYGTLKLANCFMDPSMVRETLSYEIARQYMPVSGASYADVTINGFHMGLYTNVQDVDKYFMSSQLGWSDGVRFKGELQQGGFPLVVVWDYLGQNVSSYTPYYEAESDEGWEELIEFLNVFNNDPGSMEDVLNVDQHLWMLAFDILMVNLDAPVNFAHNYYLFQDDSERFNPILWDLNMNFGGFSNLMPNQHLNLQQMQQLTPLLHVDNSYYPIISQVLNNDTYRRMYIAHMRTIIEDYFLNGEYETRALEIQAIIDQAVQNDPNKFYTYAQFLANVNSSVLTGGSGAPPGNICGITELMETRVSWLLQHDLFTAGDVPAFASVTNSPQQAAPGETITVTAQISDALSAFVAYRPANAQHFTKVAMLDDGQHGDGVAGDGVYGAMFPAGYQSMHYYIYAENAAQGAFYPARAAHEYATAEVATLTGNLVINEINYNSNDDFDCEDWVELYNPDDIELDASGWEFRDEDDTHQFFLPDQTVIPAQGYLVLVNDSELFAACFPDVQNCVGDIGFGLSGGGELLRLYDTAGTLVDSVLYDDEDPWPLAPDGEGPTLALIDPTYDNALAASWEASEVHGTPGQPNHEIAVQGEDIVPPGLALRAFPNPFNPETTVHYSLQQTGSVRLDVFNIRGQRVTTLVNDTRDAGDHSVVWQAGGQSSGVYFLRLQTDESTQVRKIMLMK